MRNTRRLNEDRQLLSLIREANNKCLLKEDLDLPETLENDSDVVVINDKSYPGIEKEEQEKFLQKIPSVDFDKNSFVYNPKKNTVTLTGSIPNLANLKFQYTTDVSTPDGCYIFVNGMTLEQTSIKVLTTLRGYYDIWVKEWSPMATKTKLSKNEAE